MCNKKKYSDYKGTEEKKRKMEKNLYRTILYGEFTIILNRGWVLIEKISLILPMIDRTYKIKTDLIKNTVTSVLMYKK